MKRDESSEGGLVTQSMKKVQISREIELSLVWMDGLAGAFHACVPPCDITQRSRKARINRKKQQRGTSRRRRRNSRFHSPTVIQVHWNLSWEVIILWNFRKLPYFLCTFLYIFKAVRRRWLNAGPASFDAGPALSQRLPFGWRRDSDPLKVARIFTSASGEVGKGVSQAIITAIHPGFFMMALLTRNLFNCNC